MKIKMDDVNAVPPNTLAWAALTLDKAQLEKKSLWRIVPDVLIKRPPKEYERFQPTVDPSGSWKNPI